MIDTFFSRTSFFLILSSALLFSACESDKSNDVEPSIDQPKYEVKGRFLSFNENDSYISVVHEDIPGVMNAMRMNLIVKDASTVTELNRGDTISFLLIREGMSWYATEITKLDDDTDLDLPDNLKNLGLD